MPFTQGVVDIGADRVVAGGEHIAVGITPVVRQRGKQVDAVRQCLAHRHADAEPVAVTQTGLVIFGREFGKRAVGRLVELGRLTVLVLAFHAAQQAAEAIEVVELVATQRAGPQQPRLVRQGADEEFAGVDRIKVIAQLVRPGLGTRHIVVRGVRAIHLHVDRFAGAHRGGLQQFRHSPGVKFLGQAQAQRVTRFIRERMAELVFQRQREPVTHQEVAADAEHNGVAPAAGWRQGVARPAGLVGVADKRLPVALEFMPVLGTQPRHGVAEAGGLNRFSPHAQGALHGGRSLAKIGQGIGARAGLGAAAQTVIGEVQPAIRRYQQGLIAELITTGE